MHESKVEVFDKKVSIPFKVEILAKNKNVDISKVTQLTASIDINNNKII